MTQPVRLSAWLSVVRRARLGRTVKAVAHALATRANNDGTGVLLGVARLSVECEVSPRVVKEAMRALREAGLIKRMGRRKFTPEYRLTLPDDGALSIPSPAEHEESVERIAVMLRGKYDPLRSPRVPADDDDLRSPSVPAETDGPDESAVTPDACRSESAVTLSALSAVTLGAHVPPPTSPVVITSHSDEKVRTRLTVPRARDADDPPADATTPVDVLPERCVHGLAARRRRDGTSSCALCRRSSDPTGLAPVIHIHRQGAAS